MAHTNTEVSAFAAYRTDSHDKHLLTQEVGSYIEPATLVYFSRKPLWLQALHDKKEKKVGER